MAEDNRNRGAFGILSTDLPKEAKQRITCKGSLHLLGWMQVDMGGSLHISK